MAIQACIVGAGGRMGLALAQEAAAAFAGRMAIASGIGREGSALLGTTIPGFPAAKIFPPSQLDEALKGCSVSIHFSSPQADAQLIPRIVQKGVNVVIGTTGFTDEQKKSLSAAISASKAAAVWAPNFSPLVNVQAALSQRATELLSPLGYDFGVVEEHHTKKLDSPSGTAKKLLSAIAKAGGPAKERYWKEEKGEKQKGEVDVAVLRLGGTAGEHEVRIVGSHGRLTIETLMYSRSDFANGAIGAALWLCEKNAKGRASGKIFSMEDVLGINRESEEFARFQKLVSGHRKALEAIGPL